jgi:hypothetical protein
MGGFVVPHSDKHLILRGYTSPLGSAIRQKVSNLIVGQRGGPPRWRGVRGPRSAPVEGEHELFGFLTTEANAVVAPIHPKAVPVILRSAEEADRWLEAETAHATSACRPLRWTDPTRN